MRSIGGMAAGIAGLVFVGSAVVFGSTVVDAVLVEEVQASPEMAPASSAPGPAEDGVPTALDAQAGQEQAATAPRESLRGRIYPGVSNDEILTAVNQDVFQPDRNPPAEPYLLPSQRAASVTTARDTRRRREPDLRIVGTAIAGDLALALVQPEDTIPFAVLLGESVEGYLMAAIDAESVMLTRDGAEYTLPVREPRQARSSNNRERNTRNRGNTDEAAAARALTERVQQMLQGMQRGQMIRGGGQGPGNVQYQFTTPLVIERGGQGGRVTTAVVRPRGGGGGGGEFLP